MNRNLINDIQSELSFINWNNKLAMVNSQYHNFFCTSILQNIIYTSENDEMIPLPEAREMAELIPGAELAVISEATHNDIVKDGSQALDIVLNFLLE